MRLLLEHIDGFRSRSDEAPTLRQTHLRGLGIAACVVQHAANAYRLPSHPVHENERRLCHRQFARGRYAALSSQEWEVLEQGGFMPDAREHVIRRREIAFRDVQPSLKSILVGARRPFKPLC